jgi:hypothetical protein
MPGPIPVPKLTEQSGPGGVSCTTPRSVAERKSASRPPSQTAIELRGLVHVGSWDYRYFKPGRKPVLVPAVIIALTELRVPLSALADIG